jgi:carotenoid cleavage dioxygenase-like enzyme
MPRYGSADDLRWYEADPTFAYHVANAREQGGDIVVDVAGSARAPLMPDATGRPPTWEDSRLTLKRWILSPATGTVRYETLDDTSLQFPRIDDRVNGRAYGDIYFNGASDPMMTREDGFDIIGAYDVRTGRKTLYNAPGESFGEPVFVSIAFRPATQTSALTVFNAAAIADGPVAEILVPVRIPAGFHCHWRGAVA